MIERAGMKLDDPVAKYLPKPVTMPARSSTSVVAVPSRDCFSLVWSNSLK
jgi:hypothetical protein